MNEITREQLEAERDFLLERADSAGSMSFHAERDTGQSSNALVRYAITGVEPAKDRYPGDADDLRACFRAREKAPAHLHPRMDDLLERYRAHVATRYPEVAESDAFLEVRGRDGIPIDEFIGRIEASDGETLDEDSPSRHP